MGYHEDNEAAGKKRTMRNTPVGSTWRVQICGAWLPFEVSHKYDTSEGPWVSLCNESGDQWGNVPIHRLGERVV